MNCGDLNAIDPLKKQPTEGVSSEGLSPMDPPDAYQPPSVENSNDCGKCLSVRPAGRS